MDLKELTDKELSDLFITKDKERKSNKEAEKVYRNCVIEINRRIDLEEKVEMKYV